MIMTTDRMSRKSLTPMGTTNDTISHKIKNVLGNLKKGRKKSSKTRKLQLDKMADMRISKPMYINVYKRKVCLHHCLTREEVRVQKSRRRRQQLPPSRERTRRVSFLPRR